MTLRDFWKVSISGSQKRFSITRFYRGLYGGLVCFQGAGFRILGSCVADLGFRISGPVEGF